MDIITLTTFFPNSADRQRAVFVENLVRAMQRMCRITVIAPVPITPPFRWVRHWYTQTQIAWKENINGIEVRHPRIIVIPKLGWLSGVGYFLGIMPILRRVRKKSGKLVVHVHCAYPDGVGVALAARVLGLPYVITAHGSDINVYARRYGLRRQIRWAMRGAKGIIAVSHDLEGKIHRLLRSDVPNVEHIPCAGYDPGHFFPRESRMIRNQLGITTQGRLAVFVGKLVPIKGVNILIAAWARLHDSGAVTESDQLVIIGEGKCREALEGQVSDAGLIDRVRFIGSIPHHEVSRWIAAADTLCLSSHNEGTPNVIVEAMACGVPVVATGVGGVPEIVIEGVNGRLVKPGDPAEFAQAIQRVLTQVWDREAISRSVAHLTWDIIAEKNCRFLDRVTREVSNGPLA
ncbi:MAG: glycosyltransferase family 4 protein [Sulfuricaulis sp.]